MSHLVYCTTIRHEIDKRRYVKAQLLFFGIPRGVHRKKQKAKNKTKQKNGKKMTKKKRESR